MPKFVLDSEHRREVESRCDVVGTDVANWNRVLRDSESGDIWNEFRLYPGSQGGGWPCLVFGEMPSASELVDLACSSEYSDDFRVAGILLASEPETWPVLLDQLEALEPNPDSKERIRVVLDCAGVHLGINRREVAGRSLGDIQLDAKHFLQLSARAKALVGE
jgi:hypothetical protein